MVYLPQPFISRMKELLKDDAVDFFASYDQPKKSGLRVNTLKISVDDFLSMSPFPLQPIPWASTGFYYEEADAPGKHVLHRAGLYYIQEPSAMAVAPALAPEPGERVLDLCAAPGGKTTHLAAFMQGRGILVANEFTPNRAKVLAENVERLGLRNTLVLNESPANLAKVFPAWFDRILVDAPCSGEGMFRKDPDAYKEWSPENVAYCSVRQLDILREAAKMLRSGGKLVYSTCTFSPDENEALMNKFLTDHPEFRLLPLINSELFSQGMPEWGNNREDLRRAVRLWPHRLQGEGHFAALLEKTDGSIPRHTRFHPKAPTDAVRLFQSFHKESLEMLPFEGQLLLLKDNLYILPANLPDISSLKWVRPGLHLGEVKKNRFEPSHTLAMSLKQSDALRSVSFHSEDPNIYKYLRGETLPSHTSDGWTLVCVDKYPLGWGKTVQHTLKNHYPKGLRIP